MSCGGFCDCCCGCWKQKAAHRELQKAQEHLGEKPPVLTTKWLFLPGEVAGKTIRDSRGCSYATERVRVRELVKALQDAKGSAFLKIDTSYAGPVVDPRPPPPPSDAARVRWLRALPPTPGVAIAGADLGSFTSRLFLV